MQPDKELYSKFPSVLKAKLMSREIEFPRDTRFKYSPIKTYRAVERAKDDYREIIRDDFKSYFELKKSPKKPRGMKQNLESDPCYYGVSSFLNEEIVRQKMRFPNPHKKMAVGYVHMEGGPQQTRKRDEHVCWWLYEDADVSGFEIKEDFDDE